MTNDLQEKFNRCQLGLRNLRAVIAKQDEKIKIMKSALDDYDRRVERLRKACKQNFPHTGVTGAYFSGLVFARDIMTEEVGDE